MKTRPLGTSGLDLTVLGYGAWEASEHWGTVDEDAIIKTIRSAVDVGTNWIDTAEVYGPHTSEHLVGRAVADLPDVMISTKVGPAPAGTGFAKDDVRRAAEGSLARLGRDVIDLFQLHWPDPEVPVEETWEAMALLVDDGLARAIGVSNFDQALIERCEAIRHVDSIQPHASMLMQANLDLIEWCGDRGIGAVVYSPLACGLLTGSISRETTFEKDDWRSGGRGFMLYDRLFGANLEKNLGTVDRVKPIAERLGASLADLAVAWILGRPGVTSAIVGSRNPKHVAANAAGASLTLDDRDRAEIDAALQG